MYSLRKISSRPCSELAACNPEPRAAREAVDTVTRTTTAGGDSAAPPATETAAEGTKQPEPAERPAREAAGAEALDFWYA